MNQREELVRKLAEQKAEDLARQYFMAALMGILSNPIAVMKEDGEPAAGYGIVCAAARKIAITAYEQDDQLMKELHEQRSKMGVDET